jgi:hypothetical protein
MKNIKGNLLLLNNLIKSPIHLQNTSQVQFIKSIMLLFEFYNTNTRQNIFFSLKVGHHFFRSRADQFNPSKYKMISGEFENGIAKGDKDL